MPLERLFNMFTMDIAIEECPFAISCEKDTARKRGTAGNVVAATVPAPSVDVFAQNYWVLHSALPRAALKPHSVDDGNLLILEMRGSKNYLATSLARSASRLALTRLTAAATAVLNALARRSPSARSASASPVAAAR